MIDTISESEFDDSPWYTQFWPWFLISLPAVIVVAGIAMIIMALRSPFALVADDYYREGLGINADLAASDQARVLGIRAELSLTATQIRIDLNSDLTDQLRLDFIHPTNEQSDRSYYAQRLGPRRFEILLDQPFDDYLRTTYSVKLVGKADNREWLVKSSLLLDKTSFDHYNILLSSPSAGLGGSNSNND